jgi:serine/threonine protein kinase/tetratricopeptide (TPR) repeat protein
MIGTIVAGRFKLEREAGSGGMGTVYRARDLSSGADVALKLLSSEEVRDAERFAQEAGILSRLSHPAIVRYVAHGTSAGQHFLAMEWLDGESLDARIDREPLSVQQAITVLRRTTEALAHAHSLGIVHRDIKPDNLFLPGADLDALKLLDFGVARLLRVNRRLTQTGTLVGTLGYLAPEVISGVVDIDGRTDFFALGCVAFRCLTGRAPFEAEDEGAVLAKIVMQEAPSVRDLAPSVPDAVAELVNWLLQKAPDRRPENAAALLAALAQLDRLPEVLPAYRARRTKAGLTLTEKRVVFLVVIGPEGGGSGPIPDDEEAKSMLTDAGQVPDSLTAIADELRTHFNATLRSLPKGPTIVTLPHGRAADFAERAARAAIRVRASLTDRSIAVAGAQTSGDGDTGMLRMVGDAGALLATTAPGRIRLDEMAAALLDARFETLREHDGVFLHGERERSGADRKLLGRATPFVGRSRELASASATLAACAEEGAAQVSIVIGAAGMGKSRLLREFLHAARREVPGIKVIVGAGDSLAAGSPFGLLARALRRNAGILDGDPIDEARRKLTASLGAHAGPSEASRWAAFLGEVAHVSFPDQHDDALRAARSNPQLMGDLMRRAFEDWLKAECQAQPVLLVLEDLHWGDSGTIALIDAVVRTLREQPLMVLALARPEVRETFPDLWSSRHPQIIELAPLARRAAEKLVRDVMGEQSSAALIARIVERADGNPFYLEELVRAAHEGRSDNLPDSVLGMVQARLDAQGDKAKQILRAASIFGERFSRTGVAALLGGDAELSPIGEWLDRLVDRELISRHTAAAGSTEFSFAHALIRDAAYATLTEEDRCLGHALAGDHLEQVGVLDAMVLAEHFRRGDEPARSVKWYREAAEQALRSTDLEGALARAECGLAALEQIDKERVIEPETRGALRLTQTEAHLWRGELVRAEQRGIEAVEALAAGGALWYRAVSQTLISVAKQGRVDLLLRWVERALDTPPAPHAGNPQLVCLAWAASFLLVASRRNEASELMNRIEQIAANLADPDPQALALLHQARAARASVMGDPAGCLTSLEAALACFEQAGDARNVSTVRANIGFIFAELGAWDRAELLLRGALENAERLGLREICAVVQHNLGRVLAIRGDHAEGERLERIAVDSFVALGELRLEGLARTYLAEIKLMAHAYADAESQLALALRVLDASPAARIQALGAMARTQLAQNRGNEALATARTAAAALEALGSIDEGEGEVRLVEAECLQAAGLTSEARTTLSRARGRLLERANQIADPGLRHDFLKIPAHARTLELAAAWNLGSQRPIAN